MLGILCCLLLTTTLQVKSASNQDLRSIFQIPNRRNYDDLEILERSNFGSDEATPTSPATPCLDTPRSYANAQVMLRFGGEGEKKCSCGEGCQCRGSPCYVPVLTPIPYYVYVSPYPNQYYAPPTVSQTPPISREEYQIVSIPIGSALDAPKPEEAEPKQVECPVNIQNDNSEPQNVDIKNNHPEILETVTLTDAAINNPEIGEDINKIKCLEEVSNKLEPTELSPTFKIVSLNLNEVSKLHRKDLEKCLLPYSSPKQKQPKLLVTYPIFNHPKSDEIVAVNSPLQYRESGYAVSKGSGYYIDPGKAVIYKKPTVLSIVEKNVAPVPKYAILVPVNQVAPVSSTGDCCCYGCAKYVGEMNEKCV